MRRSGRLRAVPGGRSLRTLRAQQVCSVRSQDLRRGRDRVRCHWGRLRRIAGLRVSPGAAVRLPERESLRQSGRGQLTRRFTTGSQLVDELRYADAECPGELEQRAEPGIERPALELLIVR